jgi:hypothetical protein
VIGIDEALVFVHGLIRESAATFRDHAVAASAVFLALWGIIVFPAVREFHRGDAMPRGIE